MLLEDLAYPLTDTALGNRDRTDSLGKRITQARGVLKASPTPASDAVREWLRDALGLLMKRNELLHATPLTKYNMSPDLEELVSTENWTGYRPKGGGDYKQEPLTLDRLSGLATDFDTLLDRWRDVTVNWYIERGPPTQ